MKQLFSTLFETFDKSSANALKRHVRAFPNARRWRISADFCVDDPGRPNDVFAFTLFPEVKDFRAMRASIATALPKDLKKTPEITDEALAFLRKQTFFHIAFLFEERPRLFDNGPEGEPPAEVVKAFTAHLVDRFRGLERGEEAIRRVEALARDAQKKSFNRKLLQQIYLLSTFFAFCSLALARERRVDLSWFSDQDDMTTAHDGLVWNLAVETLLGIARERKIKVPKAPQICVPTPIDELNSKSPIELGLSEMPPRLDRPHMWYDEFIRLPDYVAGVLSTYDLKNEDVAGKQRKHLVLTRELLAEADNLAVIKVKARDGLQFSRITFHKEPETTDTSADEGSASAQR